MYVQDDWEERRETGTLMAARALSTAPKWVQEAVEEERKIMDLPVRLQRCYRRLRRSQGIGVKPRQAGRDIDRCLRLLQTMAAD